MKLLKLTPKTYKYYREELNNNENESYDVAQRKLTRNVMLAHKEPRLPGKTSDLYKYGSLQILVADDNTIVMLKNRCRPAKGWKLDKNKYAQLNKQLGIDGRSKIELVSKEVKYFLKRKKSKLQRKLEQAIN